MTWYAFKGLNGGKAIDIAGVQEKDATAWGFHGYGTEAAAEAAPNIVSNPFTRAAADLLIFDYHEAVKQGAQPGGPNASNPIGAGVQGAVTNAGQAAGAVGSAIAGTGLDTFFGNLTTAATWIRVGEAVLGLLLITVGLLKLSESSGLAAGIVNQVPQVKAVRKIIK